MQFRKKWDYVPTGGETPTGKSMTVPSMALSINEIQQRFANGSLHDIAKEAYFSDPDNFDAIVSHPTPDLDLSDLSDATNLLKPYWSRKERKGRRTREA